MGITKVQNTKSDLQYHAGTTAKDWVLDWIWYCVCCRFCHLLLCGLFAAEDWIWTVSL